MSNRKELLESTERAILERRPGMLVGMLHVHIRRLRQISIALDHEVADAVPGAVEERLRAFLRAADLVARVGEADFLVALPNLLSPGHAELAAQRVLREFERPLMILGRPVEATLALGLAWCPEHAGSAELLARRATAALDAALGGGSRLKLASGTAEQPLLLDELRDALVNNELGVVFQPIHAVQHDGVVAVESLARWYCPNRGPIGPGRFVPLAEQGGLVPELTRWSLHATLREFAVLRQDHPELRCSINLSPRVFSDSGIAEQVAAALAIWDVAPQMLVLEVTETAVMEDPEYSARALHALRELGIGIAIDDFGKGYSSFSYLKHFPATELKIDQSFVADLFRDEHSLQLVRSMIDLAHNLGLGATAEGVEDAATLERLRALGCDHAQGYHFGRPQPREAWAGQLAPPDAGMAPRPAPVGTAAWGG